MKLCRILIQKASRPQQQKQNKQVQDSEALEITALSKSLMFLMFIVERKCQCITGICKKCEKKINRCQKK